MRNVTSQDGRVEATMLMQTHEESIASSRSVSRAFRLAAGKSPSARVHSYPKRSWLRICPYMVIRVRANRESPCRRISIKRSRFVPSRFKCGHECEWKLHSWVKIRTSCVSLPPLPLLSLSLSLSVSLLAALCFPAALRFLNEICFTTMQLMCRCTRRSRQESASSRRSRTNTKEARKRSEKGSSVLLVFRIERVIGRLPGWETNAASFHGKGSLDAPLRRW